MSDLPNLREHRALPKWLIQTCYHRCLQHRRDERTGTWNSNRSMRRSSRTNADQPLPEQMLVQLEQEQLLRDVVAEMPERCERMIRMLFFETPAATL